MLAFMINKELIIFGLICSEVDLNGSVGSMGCYKEAPQQKWEGKCVLLLIYTPAYALNKIT